MVTSRRKRPRESSEFRKRNVTLQSLSNFQPPPKNASPGATTNLNLGQKSRISKRPKWVPPLCAKAAWAKVLGNGRFFSALSSKFLDSSPCDVKFGLWKTTSRCDPKTVEDIVADSFGRQRVLADLRIAAFLISLATLVLACRRHLLCRHHPRDIGQKPGWGKRSFVEGRLRSHLREYRLNEAARLQLPRSIHSEALSVASSEKGIFNSNRDG